MTDALRDSAIEFRLAERFREHRITSGISQSDLAAKTGIHKANLSSWEREIARPSTVSLWIKWANALGLDYLEELEKAINHRHDSDAGER